MKQQEPSASASAESARSRPLEETFDEPQRAPRSLVATGKPA